MEFLTQYTRLTLSGRLQERYLTAQYKNVSSESEIPKGSLFSIVEITNPWFPSSQIGQSVINALHREYIKSSNSSDLVNFELSLKKVNETLARITQNGETDWIGKINSCLALICNNQLHLAKTGKAEAYLMRQGKISSITDEFNQNPELHPLKTFSDIISGTLQLEDKILITTPLIFDYFSKESIKQIIASNNPYEAIVEISNKLKKEKEKKVALIVIELISKDQVANSSVDEKNEVVYLDQGNSYAGISLDTKSFFNDLIPYWEKTKKFIQGTSSSLFMMISKSFAGLKPHTKKLFTATNEQFKKGHLHLKNKILPQIHQSIKPVSDKIGQISHDAINKNQFLKDNLSVHHYTNLQKNAKIASLINKIKDIWQIIVKAITNALSWLFNPKNRSILYAISVIILSLILILSINTLRNKQNTQVTQESLSATLANAQNKFDDDFKLAILYNDKEKAKTILSDILAATTNVNSKDQNLINQANILRDKAQGELDKLNNTNRIRDLSEITSFDNPQAVAKTQDYIYSLDSTNKLSFSTLTNAHKEDLTLPNDSGDILAITPSEESDLIYALTDKNKLFKITNPLEQATEIKPINESWKTGVSIKVFAGNIYILDANGNQIWKFSVGPDGFSSAQSFITTGIDIGDGIDFTIDGVIYVLKSNGDIYKLSKGKKQDFSIKDIPKISGTDKALAAPKKIYTNADANYLYVLDGNRLLELEKSGKFVAQYAFDELNDLKDFLLNTKTKEIWLLNGNRIYKGNL